MKATNDSNCTCGENEDVLVDADVMVFLVDLECISFLLIIYYNMMLLFSRY